MSRTVRFVLTAAVVAALTGCATPVKPLYSWDAFPRQQYDTLLNAGTSANEQIAAMQAHGERARATGANLPPGFRAHLGMLHLSVGDALQAKQLWEAEKANFPESTPYMDQLLRRLDPKSPKAENPA